MSQDYAKPKRAKKSPQQNRRKPPPPRFSAWAALFTGFLGGILVSALSLYWYVNRPSDIEDSGDEQSKLEDIKPRFDFYTLLKEKEVFVPESDAPLENRDAEQRYHYLIQAGSFRKFNDADSLRAQLLLLNLNAIVETTGSGGSDSWHRVLVGPFDSNSKAAKARSTLLQNGIDNILLKRKKDS